MDDLNEIDDFEEIESSGRLKEDLTLSNIYNVKIGGFGDKELVKTYLATLTVDELEQDISVYETLSKDKSWPVSQIIQREVDKIRVSNISKDYVLRPERQVKYFPPLIIAMLPRNVDDTFALTLNYDVENSEQIKEYIFEKSNYRNNPKLKEYFKKADNRGLTNGFYLLQVSKVFEFNILCWDKSKYYAVVIDGQHRLESLIQSKKQNPLISNYYQDIVFVEFSHLIKKLEGSISPVEVVRRVFVDINTNAKRVGIVRQILMDDKDLSSLLVQSLVDSINRDGNSKPKFLKSQVVDWYGESLKHSLPHITGILALQQIISDYVLDGSMSSIEDMRSPNKVKKWVRTLNEFFLVDKLINKGETKYSDIKPLEKSLKEYNDQRSFDEEIYDDEIDFKETALFVYDYRTLGVAQDTFENLYQNSIVLFFDEFVPYKEVYTIINENKGFDHNSTIYKALLSSRKKINLNSILKDAIVKLKSELEERLNEKYYILLSVLGQKTLFNILFKRIFQTFNQEFTEDIILGITNNFLSEINLLTTRELPAKKYIFGKKEQFTLDNLESKLFDMGTIASHFWDGIIYEDNRIIYNSQGIKSLSSAIEFFISLDKAIKNGKETPPFEILFMKQRIKRILKKSFDLSEDELNSNVKDIIKRKEEFIIKIFKDMNSTI